MSSAVEYQVTGMTCAHCVASVTEEVSALDGVTEVRVDLATGSLSITSDAEVPFSDVERAVEEAGYTVTP